MIRGTPMNFTPKGLCDAYDATEKFPGACRQLTDMIFNPSNPELVYTRPGVVSIATFVSGGFNTPTNVTLSVSVGNYTMGFVTTQRNPGFDEPFLFNHTTTSFVTIANVTAANVPAMTNATGDWTPPMASQIGAYMVMTHPGFSGGAANSTFTASITGFVMNVTVLGTGAITIGQLVGGAGVTAGTYVQAFDGGTGGTGNYFVNITQTVVSEAMTGTGTNYFGMLNITNLAAPVWAAGNLGVNPLTAVPTNVSNFNNRAYFAVGNTTPFSDDLLMQRSTAAQSLTIGDSSPVTGMSGLPIQTTSSGTIAALTLFKPSQVWQVTGDITTSTLALSPISLQFGTNSPRSVVQSALGVYFASPFGPYIVNLLGAVQPVTNRVQDQDPDIILPFSSCTAYTRIAAAYAGSIYRICIPTVLNGTNATVDYWFDERKRRWTGPHSFAYDCASQVGNNFILVSNANNGQLIFSQLAQNITTVFTDLGVALIPMILSSTLPKSANMNEKQVVESTQELATGNAEIVVFVEMQDEQGDILDVVDIQVVPSGPLWGSVAEGGSGLLWGSIAEGGSGALWTSGQMGIPHVYTVSWHAPLVSQKFAVNIGGVSGANMVVGPHRSKFEDCGYMNLTAPNTL